MILKVSVLASSCLRVLERVCRPSSRCLALVRQPGGPEEFVLAEAPRLRADELAEALRRRPGLHRHSESSHDVEGKASVSVGFDLNTK